MPAMRLRRLLFILPQRARYYSQSAVRVFAHIFFLLLVLYALPRAVGLVSSSNMAIMLTCILQMLIIALSLSCANQQLRAHLTHYLRTNKALPRHREVLWCTLSPLSALLLAYCCYERSILQSLFGDSEFVSSSAYSLFIAFFLFFFAPISYIAMLYGFMYRRTCFETIGCSLQTWPRILTALYADIITLSLTAYLVIFFLLTQSLFIPVVCVAAMAVVYLRYPFIMVKSLALCAKFPPPFTPPFNHRTTKQLNITITLTLVVLSLLMTTPRLWSNNQRVIQHNAWYKLLITHHIITPVSHYIPVTQALTDSLLDYQSKHQDWPTTSQVRADCYRRLAGNPRVTVCANLSIASTKQQDRSYLLLSNVDGHGLTLSAHFGSAISVLRFKFSSLFSNAIVCQTANRASTVCRSS